jgi:hypothetical protein
MLVLLFTVSMFSSAVLLFLVEPMLAKLMLPLLGGSPAVWSTCLVFFQAVLLAGYLYAHAATKWLGRRVQIALHLTLVFLPLSILGILPLHLPAGWEPPAVGNPVPAILSVLLVAVGLPFFALSSNASIMQSWFAGTGHKQAKDPYFLYAASNAGSLVGLLAYPFFIEPHLPLSEQRALWSSGYLLFAAMTLACAFLGWRKSPTSGPAASGGGWESAPCPWRLRIRWIALAFVPSSLMLGVTTALTTDVPAIPLFWVLPLAIYLASFILTFLRHPPISHRRMIQILPVFLLLALFPTVTRMNFPFVAFLAVCLLLLFCVAMVFHGELARSRPQIGQLTEFYLWISVGGGVGGVFNALIAPVVFHSVLEFPLVLILAALLRPTPASKPLEAAEAVWTKRKDWLLPLALGLCMTMVIEGISFAGIKPGPLAIVLFFAYSMLWCIGFRKRPRRFAAGITAMLIASSFFSGPYGHVLDSERSFFGVLRVSNDPTGKFRYLLHGGTLHGVQSLDPARSREPLAYYTRSGPAGQIFRALQARMPHGDWAVVGLGAGAMACYLQPGQTLTYYEIDPLVARIAEDHRYFTFLQQCAPQARIILGDARLKLRVAPDSHYDLIVIDAFSGDSIPMHLMTREALALYQRKLAPGGILAFHISNNYLRIAPTLGDLAGDAHLLCAMEDDTALTQAQADEGKSASKWVVMARNQADLDDLMQDRSAVAHWTPLKARAGAGVWTDDYSSLLSLIKWTWG